MAAITTLTSATISATVGAAQHLRLSTHACTIASRKEKRQLNITSGSDESKGQGKNANSTQQICFVLLPTIIKRETSLEIGWVNYYVKLLEIPWILQSR